MIIEIPIEMVNRGWVVSLSLARGEHPMVVLSKWDEEANDEIHRNFIGLDFEDAIEQAMEWLDNNREV